MYRKNRLYVKVTHWTEYKDVFIFLQHKPLSVRSNVLHVKIRCKHANNISNGTCTHCTTQIRCVLCVCMFINSRICMNIYGDSGFQPFFPSLLLAIFDQFSFFISGFQPFFRLSGSWSFLLPLSGFQILRLFRYIPDENEYMCIQHFWHTYFK